jgi:NarL family two-component system response regulator LiaR
MLRQAERSGTSGGPARLVRPRALVVEPSALLGAGLAAIVVEAGLDLAGEARTLEESLELASRLRPDLILLGAELLHAGEGLGVAQLRERAPGAQVVVLANSPDASQIRDVVEAGAAGYLDKALGPGELAAAIRVAITPGALVLPRLAAGLLGRGRRPSRGAELSKRELEVLRLLVGGQDNGRIAAELSISPSTAKAHVAQILRKLHTQNRIQAAVYAVQTGLV